jgi:adenosine deaminase
MADKDILVEINLTSNEDTLGIAGKNHPFPIYRAFGVPVALSTDEEGIERIELTHEYVQAVQSYSLIYPDLKENRPQQRRIWPLADASWRKLRGKPWCL